MGSIRLSQWFGDGMGGVVAAAWSLVEGRAGGIRLFLGRGQQGLLTST